ncbi:MAG TPA: hypothetical protein DEH11_04360 [Actinobacteria bacterium]|nr:hypothetical protein [Actinomycetota bacterium]
MTCPAAHTSAVRQLPRARFAPNIASAIRNGQAAADPVGKNALAIRQPTGSWRRLWTFVLAHRSTAAWSGPGSSA